VDGDALVFARTAIGDNLGSSTTILYRVAGPGQEPGRVAPVATFPFATYAGITYTPDGRLLYTKGTGGVTDPSNGIYELSEDGRTVRQVTQGSEDLGMPFLLGVTASDQTLVSYSLRYSQNFADPATNTFCFLALIDLATTERTPLRMPDGSCAVWAGLGGDGSALVLLSTGPAGLQLASADVSDPVASVTAMEVGDALDPDDTSANEGPFGYAGNEDFGLTVTDHGAVLLREGPDGGLLLTLGAAAA